MAVACWVGSVNKGGGGCKPDFVWLSELVQCGDHSLIIQFYCKLGNF